MLCCHYEVYVVTQLDLPLLKDQIYCFVGDTNDLGRGKCGLSQCLDKT